MIERRPALGKGLSALIPDTPEQPRQGTIEVDIDLLLLGDAEFSSDRLTLPHREVSTRRFVLVPLLEIAPDLTLPDGRPVADLLDALDDDPDQAVTPSGPLPFDRSGE